VCVCVCVCVCVRARVCKLAHTYQLSAIGPMYCPTRHQVGVHLQLEPPQPSRMPPRIGALWRQQRSCWQMLGHTTSLISSSCTNGQHSSCQCTSISALPKRGFHWESESTEPSAQQPMQ